MTPKIIITEFNECSAVDVSFNYKASRTSGYNDDITNQESVSDIRFFVPSDKAESFKKACIRLSELAKEENKGPFQN